MQKKSQMFFVFEDISTNTIMIILFFEFYTENINFVQRRFSKKISMELNDFFSSILLRI